MLYKLKCYLCFTPQSRGLMVSRYESQSILRCFICICLSEFCISVFFLLSYDTLESALDPGLCLSIFQVIGGQLRCLIGKWWNNCTQLSSAVLYSITNDRIIAPYSIAIYSLLPHHTLYCCIILYSTILSIANDRIIVALNTTILYLALQCVLSCVSLRIPPYFLYCIAMYHRFILRSILHNYIWTICMCLHVWMSAEYQIVEVILRHSLWDIWASDDLIWGGWSHSQCGEKPLVLMISPAGCHNYVSATNKAHIGK